MNDEITVNQFRRWVLVYAQRIEEEEDRLTALDAAIGDADHGVNMQRGMVRVRQRLEVSTEEHADDIGSLLRQVAMTLISSVGGAAGPLYGAFFLWAAKQAGASRTVSPVQLAAMWRMGLNGVQQRGKAQPGEKTMIDVLAPAVAALENATQASAVDGEPASAPASALAVALAEAVAAAEAGMEHTVGLQALKGRASYLGPRSVGHMDPGAASAYMLVCAAAETLVQETTGEPGTGKAETDESMTGIAAQRTTRSR